MRNKYGVDIFALFIGNTIPQDPKLRKKVLTWKRTVLQMCSEGRDVLL